MKKSFFGYSASEVDVMMNALREENESLNATINTLKTQIKNNEIGGAKANLLEASLKSSEENLKRLIEEKNGLMAQIAALSAESEDLKRQNAEFHRQIAELTNRSGHEALSLMETPESWPDSEKDPASVISFRAYYEMSRMRNEVVEYLHEQMQEYQKSVNESSVKTCDAVEERQSEYNQMINDFFARASEFRVGLPTGEDKFGNMADYSPNIDKIADSMDEIMDHFIKESGAYLKRCEGEEDPDKAP